MAIALAFARLLILVFPVETLLTRTRIMEITGRDVLVAVAAGVMAAAIAASSVSTAR